MYILKGDNTMAAEKKARKPRTVDPDQRLALVDKQIERFSNLAASREELLQKTEALAAERREALEKTNAKLKALQEKRARIVSLKERREAKAAGIHRPTPKQAELAELAALKQILAEKGMTLDDLKNSLK